MVGHSLHHEKPALRRGAHASCHKGEVPSPRNPPAGCHFHTRRPVRKLPLCLKLANDLFGNGFIQAGFGLNGEPTRHLLGILKYVERIDFAPSHSNNMKTAVEV